MILKRLKRQCRQAIPQIPPRFSGSDFFPAVNKDLRYFFPPQKLRNCQRVRKLIQRGTPNRYQLDLLRRTGRFNDSPLWGHYRANVSRSLLISYPCKLPLTTARSTLV
jgi:hypothetical protein